MGKKSFITFHGYETYPIKRRAIVIRKLSELGGLALHTPLLAIFFVIIALANIALPLTNAFVGEFLMFNGLFRYNIWMAAAAGVSVILAAVYTLNMVQKVLYGTTHRYYPRY